MIKSVPNLITVARLIAVPYVTWLLLHDSFHIAFWVFIAAGISDGIDGYLAKALDARSKLGGYLDPIADKALLIAVFVTLTYLGHVESWFLLLLIIRDLVILTGAFCYHIKTHSLEIKPLFIGKMNTAFQIVLAGMLLASPGFDLAAENALGIMTGITAATALLSGIAYIVKWGKMASEFDAKNKMKDKR